MKIATKKCIRCGTIYPLTNFYKHDKMADGYLNKCKDCTKIDSNKRYAELVEADLDFVPAERSRQREKYKRLYRGVKPNPGIREKATENYKERYPEKRNAISMSANIDCPEGFHKHHWSYNDEHFKDVIILPAELHYKVHRFMLYDATEKMYRTAEGTLLETRQLHECFIEIVKQIF